ncbi:hypothetical protein NQ318_003649 [Aromia moschata]|uniref:Peroxisomal membrane protein PEX16 n=1 Tax=Aromia moschata TaxID=1265417 RepID=A0AAV8Y246_9CUCU|nr:hypothetical protein NQ318_003649 [Aromia moschata]
MSVLLSLPELFNSYKNWVSKNPQAIGDWETSAKLVSYFVAGRINNSHVVSELILCLSNLLVMLNDSIIKKNWQIDSSTPADRVKLWLTVVEYSEVFCELSAKKLWGTAGKWIVIVSIQVFKCIARLMLIYHYKESIVQNPPVPVLDRKSLKPNEHTTVGDIAQTHLEPQSFTLKRSGRVVRKVDASPPITMRRWKPLLQVQAFTCENKEDIEQVLIGRHLVAETIYITKPIVHLASMAYFGTKTWKPWMISLALDLSSLHLYRPFKSNKINSLTPHQRMQLSRRIVALLFYLIRSPFYEKQSEDKINTLLTALSKHVPLAGLVCNPLIQYLPFWQDTYFYMWST